MSCAVRSMTYGLWVAAISADSARPRGHAGCTGAPCPPPGVQHRRGTRAARMSSQHEPRHLVARCRAGGARRARARARPGERRTRRGPWSAPSVGAAGLLPAPAQVGKRRRLAGDDARAVRMAALHERLPQGAGIARVAEESGGRSRRAARAAVVSPGNHATRRGARSGSSSVPARLREPVERGRRWRRREGGSGWRSRRQRWAGGARAIHCVSRRCSSRLQASSRKMTRRPPALRQSAVSATDTGDPTRAV